MPLETLADECLYIDRDGSGPALVLTHGLGDTAATWDRLRAALGARFTTVAWDLLGHGRSAKPTQPDAYSRDLAVRDLDAVAARAGDDVVLVGHSLGGYLSQCSLVRNPRAARALVLIATGPGYRSVERRDDWNRYAGKAAANFDIPASAARMVEQHDDLVMANLARLTLPVLIVVGERDRAYHGASDYLCERLGDARAVRIPDAGHHVHRSHAEPVGEAIARFVDGLEPPIRASAS